MEEVKKWSALPDHDTDDRTVSVPFYDPIRAGKLRNTMEQAAARISRNSMTGSIETAEAIGTRMELVVVVGEI